jgi:hypothetical protein
MNPKSFITTLLLLALAGCRGHDYPHHTDGAMDWRSALRQKLPLLGHRNWILVVDKAFPEQNAAGLELIDTNADLVEVLSATMQEIDSSTHVVPLIYGDAELAYLTEQMSPGVDALRRNIASALGGRKPEPLLHESVFTKIDEAAKLFKVLVLKTNGTIPYSSIFLQLDCKYWSADKEKALRAAMKEPR